MRDIPVLYIVIPCYNEANTLPVTAPLFLNKIQELIERNLVQDSSRILFVDDGSKDDTWQIISTLAKNNKYFAGIAQSRNRGHQNAVLAGLMESKDKCDITISIDCDGQDDLNAMNEMVKSTWKDLMWCMACAMTALPIRFLSVLQQRRFISCCV